MNSVVDSLTPGSLFADRYEILQLIGNGGMSSVYKAADRLTADVIALKVVPNEESSDPAIQESFRQEVVIARRLAHPNVVRIYDIGLEGMTRYVTMELIDGRDLAVLLNDRGPFRFSEFEPVFRQLWTALDYIHSHGIVHCDLKLRNLMLARDGTLKVMDFGIALALDDASPPADWRGTPGYLAPELASGGAPSPASDIYAAGIACIELLTGRKPRDDGEFGEELPPDIRQLLKHLIDPNPEKRPHSAAAVLNEAEHFLKGAAVSMPQARTLFELISAEPAHADIVIPLMAAIAKAAAQLPPEHAGLSPQLIRLNADESVAIQTGPADAKYSAPEFFQEGSGDDAKSAPAARVYILGFIFFELLAGRRIFEQQFADVLRSGDDLAWFEWHGNTEKSLPRLSDVAADCSQALSDVIEQMVRKRADQRIGNLAEVAERLGQLGTSFEHTVMYEMPKTRPPFWTAGKVLVLTTALFAAALCCSWRYFPNLWAEIIEAFLKHDGQVELAAAAAVPDVIPAAPQPPPPPQPETPPPPPPPANLDTATGPMALIPEGDLQMGNNAGRKSERFKYQNEAPQHSVHLAAFYIDQTEVINAAYAEFCKSGAHVCPSNPPWDAHYFERADYPVMNVSWSDAQAFCNWAGKALPTEAQWERAARGDQESLFPWGNDLAPKNANLKGGDDGYEFAAPAASFPQDRSAFGVFDMAGNVPEWTADDYALYLGNTAVLPVEEQNHKVVRGGGFMMDSSFATATNRASAAPAIRPGKTLQVGFRCAASVDAAIPLGLKR